MKKVSVFGICRHILHDYVLPSLSELHEVTDDKWASIDPLLSTSSKGQMTLMALDRYKG
jgi:hypothetical protein